MEGEYANRIPLRVKECALVVEECLTGSIFADILTMGKSADDGFYLVFDC